jgi:CubicO group peptidase (beta-lactamase class C family)
MLAALRKERLRDQPGTKFVYSDIGFMTLGEIVFSLTGTEVDKFAAQNIFEPLAMNDSLFLRFPRSGLQGSLFRIAPTENIRGQNSYLGSKFEGDADTGNKILRGAVHDPTAFRMGGAAGHAGLFSTADDLARYCQMILNGGVYGGRRILSAQTIALMTRPYVVSETGATRGLGWDMNTTFSRNRGELFPLGSFGHTGFTGTSIWIDPTSGTFVVFLSNRVHPDGKGDVGDLRARVAGVVASAITDVPVEKWREAEARYYAAVNAQIAAFPKTPPPK